MYSAWLFFLLIIAVWILFYLMTTRRKHGQARSTLLAEKTASARLLAKSPGLPGFSGLVRACMGDSARATRLVQFEQRKPLRLHTGKPCQPPWSACRQIVHAKLWFRQLTGKEKRMPWRCSSSAATRTHLTTVAPACFL
jgi:hypothetical protein